MAIGSAETLRAMIVADSACSLSADNYNWYYTSETEDTLKTRSVVGNGSCVLLVQDRTGAEVTTLWIKGPIIKGNSAVPYGAAIASGWDAQGRYPSHNHHNHAAIYLRTTKNGLVVVDQWPGINLRNFPIHTLRYGNRLNPPSNDGNEFYLILTQKIHVQN